MKGYNWYAEEWSPTLEKSCECGLFRGSVCLREGHLRAAIWHGNVRTASAPNLEYNALAEPISPKSWYITVSCPMWSRADRATSGHTPSPGVGAPLVEPVLPVPCPPKDLRRVSVDHCRRSAGFEARARGGVQVHEAAEERRLQRLPRGPPARETTPPDVRRCAA